ncbi:MAG: alpha/beta fold hydrolase [Rhodocyclaceae bacterium]|nr:alpha/beta fold hydrolase [Rhodocyclaceae bacterium]
MALKGGKRAVFLLHGLYSSALELQYLARRLNAAGYSVYVPQLPGYTVNAGRYGEARGSWEIWLNAAQEALRPVLEEHGKVAVGGLCIGADLALMLAARLGDRLGGLMLLSTTLYYDGWSLPWYKFLLPLAYYTPLGRFYSYKEKEPFGLKNEQMRRLVAFQMRQVGVSDAGASRLRAHGIYQAHRLIRAVKQNLPQVRNPVLIVHATEDDISSLKSVKHLEKELGSTRVDKLLLGDSYHMVSLDNEKAKVAEAMMTFLESEPALWNSDK